ncbi:hypothetical protein [Zhongshania sp. BJYM1]|uniref:hypothetical protein n=1 Tax=Zhongshania aquatica TaxID=2965069 RepID=UPI0022B44EF9|nr:hypothetical protein [Marortus sp. BJYM1]
MVISLRNNSLILLSSVLLACGGGSNSGAGVSSISTQSIMATPSLGKVSQVKIEVYQADGESLLASSIIGGEGNAEISIEGYEGPILAKLTALENAKYFDEALATTIDLPEGLILHALSSSVNDIAITPLTELAYQYALVLDSFPLSTASALMLNDAIKSVFAPNLASILSAPVLLGDTAVNSLADDDAGNYALVLAALALLGDDDTSGQPAIATLKALAQDIVDGRVDGRKNDEAITNLPYNSFMSDFNMALKDAAATYAYQGDTNKSNVSDMILVLREPETGTSTAEDCSQTWQLVDGLAYQMVYEVTNLDNGIKTTTSSDTTTKSGVEFNGEQTFEARSVVEVVSSIAPDQVFESVDQRYFSAAEINARLLTHGFVETTMQDGFNIETIESNTPGALSRFDLSRGDSYSQTFQQRRKVEANGVPVQDASTEVEYEILYEGRETIIVPAGAFEACKFSLYNGPRKESVSDGAIIEIAGGEKGSDIWISSGSGLLLRQLVGQTEELLLEATIADEAITGN